MIQNNPIYLERLEKEHEIHNGYLIKNAKSNSATYFKGVATYSGNFRDRLFKLNVSNKRALKSYFGLAAFLFIFTFLISNYMHDLGYYVFLIGYIPNQDLVATVLTRWGGPFEIWKDLYPENMSENHNWLSVNVINYTALLGLTYVIAKEVYQCDDLHLGWSMGILMCLMTYLLPSPVITYVMDKVYERFPAYNSLAVFAGFITMFSIIFTETYILENFRPTLVKISKTFIELGNIL